MKKYLFLLLSCLFLVLSCGKKAAILLSPTGVTVLAGDGNVRISWNAVPTALFYNIYWGDATGVTISNGTKIARVTSPHVHSNLVNGQTYYYIVTAVATMESAPSDEVPATPMGAGADGGPEEDGGPVEDGGALADGGSVPDGGAMADGGSVPDGGVSPCKLSTLQDGHWLVKGNDYLDVAVFNISGGQSPYSLNQAPGLPASLGVSVKSNQVVANGQTDVTGDYTTTYVVKDNLGQTCHIDCSGAPCANDDYTIHVVEPPLFVPPAGKNCIWVSSGVTQLKTYVSGGDPQVFTCPPLNGADESNWQINPGATDWYYTPGQTPWRGRGLHASWLGLSTDSNTCAVTVAGSPDFWQHQYGKLITVYRMEMNRLLPAQHVLLPVCRESGAVNSHMAGDSIQGPLIVRHSLADGGGLITYQHNEHDGGIPGLPQYPIIKKEEVLNVPYQSCMDPVTIRNCGCHCATCLTDGGWDCDGGMAFDLDGGQHTGNPNCRCAWARLIYSRSAEPWTGQQEQMYFFSSSNQTTHNSYVRHYLQPPASLPPELAGQYFAQQHIQNFCVSPADCEAWVEEFNNPDGGYRYSVDQNRFPVAACTIYKPYP